ncbi:aminoglycoside phosphotransferase family protein [Microlunatus soli]|uniref:aminoglycoside phosphotransferase family protein n=1 Tax=Microlunatus soli TaxID=630515 RepID=UPI0012F8B242|nr:aminoglycoside phosphotransferase family protein [Microlunatus soli]
MNRPEQVRRAAESLLGLRITAPPRRIERGYGNENWWLSGDDREYLLKIAPPAADLGKLTASARAHRLAVERGVPAPELVIFEPACAELDGRTVRIVDYLDTVHPPEVLTADTVPEFFAGFGAAVATLHSVRPGGFASRVGGSTTFPTWADYVDFRVPQIRGRALATDLYPAADWNAMLDRARDLAAVVSDVVEPSLVHRDLYLDNVLADRDGRFAAIIDFDGAEVWDPVVDFVKLRWQVFGEHPGSAAAYLQGYASVAGPIRRFAERLHVVEILELANHAANAALTDNPAFAEQATARLDVVLGSTPDGPAVDLDVDQPTT